MKNKEQFQQLVGKLAQYLDFATRKGVFGSEEVVDWYNTASILQSWDSGCSDCEEKKKAKAVEGEKK